MQWATIRPVEYLFETTAEVGDWTVLQFELSETLGEPYSCRLLLSQPTAVGSDPAAFGGASCVVTLHRDGAVERRQGGIVKSVTLVGWHLDAVEVELEIVPALYALAQRRNSRIFQHQDAKAIIAAILDETLSAYERTANLAHLGRTLPRREYTVQHRESDLELIHRLMAEEGISYFFNHSGDQEELVLFDANEVCLQIETVDGGEIPIADARDCAPTESLAELELRAQMRPTSVVLRDFDFTQPAVNMIREQRSTDGMDRDRELYEAGPVSTIHDYQGPAYGAEDGDEQARLRLEAERAQEKHAVGSSNVIAMRPGGWFETTNHALSDDKYLVTSVHHRGQAPDWRGADDQNGAYTNEVTCIPFDRVYRPARRRGQPRMPGPQTATVVGPAGEEVFTDEHGRIKVQFHWDREGRRDENSSCWLRVAQTWAGAGFGTMFIPRLGMEVVVHFLDGHPDRPVVIGCVYNGENPTPYPLPDHKTKSTLYTNSSIGNGGHNELTFEDAKDRESIYQHAQKNWQVDVGNDMATNVGNDQNLEVGANRDKQVAGDQSMTIDGNHETTIAGDRSRELSGNLEQSIDSDRRLCLAGNDDETTCGDRTVAVSGNHTLSVSGSRTTGTSGDETLSVGGTRTLSVGGGHCFTETITGDRNIAGAVFEALISGAETKEVTGPVNFKWHGQNWTFSGSLKEENKASAESSNVGGVTGGRSKGRFSALNLAASSQSSLTKAELTGARGAKVTVTPEDIVLTCSGSAKIEIDAANIKLDGVLECSEDIICHRAVHLQKGCRCKLIIAEPAFTA